MDQGEPFNKVYVYKYIVNILREKLAYIYILFWIWNKAFSVDIYLWNANCSVYMTWTYVFDGQRFFQGCF